VFCDSLTPAQTGTAPQRRRHHARALSCLAAVAWESRSPLYRPPALVGDLVDRGPDSAGVLRAVHQMVQAGQGDTLCLMGNHERMMLDFLADPQHCGPRWLRAGGADTLASFGLNPWGPARGKDTATQMTDLAQGLHAALPEGMLDWMRDLPLVWHTDGLSVVHAAADPACAVDAQSDKTLLWGHPDFLTRPRSDGIWIAHGHTIVPQACATQGRIATDTGAYKTDRLSAAWIDRTGLSWLVV